MSVATPGGEAETRCVLLVDMDCFYVQVEQQLRPGHAGRPAAVVQYRAWRGGGIIAINYEARAFGVRRGHHGDDARRLCPHIELYRVPERGGKADLGRYRAAGARVLGVIGRFSDIVQRASIDEAFVQLPITTDQVRELPTANQLANTLVVGYDQTEEQRSPVHEEAVPEQLEDAKQGEADSADRETGDVIERMKADNQHRRTRASLSVQRFLSSATAESTLTYGDRVLAAGAATCEIIRQAVFDETGYRCSAGVAHNKLMAKVCASLNKPNGQVLLLAAQVRTLLAPMPVRKLRFLGGKLGASVEQQLGCNTLGQLVEVPQSQMLQHFDAKTANWLHQLAQGRDSEPVNPQLLPKSIGCGRNFRGPETLRTEQRVRQWLQQLSEEIAERLQSDSQMHARRATSLTVSTSDDSGRHMSRSAPLRRHTCQGIVDTAYQLLSKLRANGAHGTTTSGAATSTTGKETVAELSWNPPITNISLCASRFVETANVRIDEMLSRAASLSSDSPGSNPLCSSSLDEPVGAASSTSGAKPVISVATFANASVIDEMYSSISQDGSASSERIASNTTSQSRAEAVSNQETGFFARRIAQLKRQQKDSPQEDGQEDEHQENGAEASSGTTESGERGFTAVSSMRGGTSESYFGGGSGDSGAICESISSETTECPRCGQQVSPWSLPEHLDWHVAVDLSKQLSAEDSTTARCSATASSNPNSRRGRGRSKRSSKTRGTGAARKVQRRGSLNTIDRFFRSS